MKKIIFSTQVTELLCTFKSVALSVNITDCSPDWRGGNVSRESQQNEGHPGDTNKAFVSLWLFISCFLMHKKASILNLLILF